ncbi:aromatic amino acid aminotransferase [Psychrobacter sp. Sarcosine-02u-2]|uniref:amino acid aminotransferase n=1 Tax=Psychrobacter sp. Sarcosine-02u-2 TaxID=2058324 RepID=UPI000C79A024|nr:amino acid aminotransferase [Psychrobacter sp. Sarcosine-02u-2]PKG84618.1 aromatic amino acid aminotransferase [Psychrobacter sp. Sarcosine-02u-2]
MFERIDYYAGDPILGLMDKFAADTNPDKVNLGVGVYYDEDGKLPVLECVKTAEQRIADPISPRPYLPMAGLPGHRKGCQELLFGKDAQILQDGLVATIATIGGSGALKVGAEFIHEWFPQSKCYVSDPTWGNHIAIFEGSDVEVGKYPYYDKATSSVKFDEMIAFFETLNKNDVVLLHPCCHNPTGMDLTREQWDTALTVIKARELIPFMDIAYQGFGKDMDSDAYAIRKAVEMGLPVFVSNSFSKNLSLYGERVGGLSVVCPSTDEAERVFGQLNATVRRIYSSPPSHGGLVVDIVMNDEALHEQWVGEVYAMRDRIKAMRLKLKSVLEEKVPGRDFDYLTEQNGMFSFTGLTPEQVEKLQSKYGIYMVSNSRMCVAGLNSSNIDYVANAMVDVLKD